VEGHEDLPWRDDAGDTQFKVYDGPTAAAYGDSVVWFEAELCGIVRVHLKPRIRNHIVELLHLGGLGAGVPVFNSAAGVQDEIEVGVGLLNEWIAGYGVNACATIFGGKDTIAIERSASPLDSVLIFNLLPVFPLDGGQIVRGLLWFPFGEFRSLQIASVIGLVGGAIFGIVGLMAGSVWWAILAFFLLSRAWYGWQQAKAMIAMSRMQMPIPPAPIAPENPPPQ